MESQTVQMDLTKTLVYNTEQDNQEAGLNKAVAFALSMKKQLVSVVWSHQDPGLSHHFTITYHDQEAVVDENSVKSHQHWRETKMD